MIFVHVVTIGIHAVRFSQSKLYSTTSSESELKLNITSQLVQLCQSCTTNVQLGFSVSIQDHVIVISFVCSSSSFTSIVQLSLPVYHSLGTYSIVSNSHVVQIPLLQLFTNPLNSTVPLPQAQSLTSESSLQFTQDHLQTFANLYLRERLLCRSRHHPRRGSAFSRRFACYQNLYILGTRYIHAFRREQYPFVL